MRQTYGKLLPGMRISDLSGKLIVIEGTDGVGRTTQIDLLKPWLEELGHAVLDTGMARSTLAEKDSGRAKEGNNLGRVTPKPFLRDGFYRSPGERDRSGAAVRVHRADRPVRLFADGEGLRSRNGLKMDSQHLQRSVEARCDILFAAKHRPTDSPRCFLARVRLLGVGDGSLIQGTICSTAFAIIRRR